MSNGFVLLIGEPDHCLELRIINRIALDVENNHTLESFYKLQKIMKKDVIDALYIPIGEAWNRSLDPKIAK
ncbi:hypothetical protein ABF87_04835 [Nitrosomonas sp. JL21]|nr:hypothetical protein [Nitrosomonas sp. JL21]